jgi:hypothetical protein
MAGLTSIPTETSGSLGTDKVDRYPRAVDTDTISAAEWNTTKHAVAEMAGSWGLGDGSTPGSGEAALRELNAPGAGMGRWAIVEDFINGLSLWTDGSSGGLAWIDGEAQNNPASGIGWLTVESGSAGGNHGTAWFGDGVDQRPFRAAVHAIAAQPLEFRTRIRTHEEFADATFSVGFINHDGTRRCLLKTNTSGQWVADIASTTGGASATATFGTVTPDSFHDILIRVVAATKTAQFYVDGVLLHTFSNHNGVLQGNDSFTARLRIDRVANAGDSLFVDYVTIRGAR